MDWRKSSYSDSNGGNCVEAASGEVIRVRDTTNRDGGTLAVTAGAWAIFTAGLKFAA